MASAAGAKTRVAPDSKRERFARKGRARRRGFFTVIILAVGLIGLVWPKMQGEFNVLLADQGP